MQYPLSSYRQILTPSSISMYSLSAHFQASLPFSSSSNATPKSFKKTQFCVQNETPTVISDEPIRRNGVRRGRVKESEAELKRNWLASLSCPLLNNNDNAHFVNVNDSDESCRWVVGIDPDVSGALALLKYDQSGSCCSSQVFDSPYVQMLVGKTTRKRLDAKSIVQLVRSFEAPIGTTAYIEQSIPFPNDGKQGWWSGGFGYGLWIGILVASGFSVVPVPSNTWKTKFELNGSRTSKDDSRRLASTFFPSMSSLLGRKKDHGRAEALLIAAYGMGQMNELDLSPYSILEKMET